MLAAFCLLALLTCLQFSVPVHGCITFKCTEDARCTLHARHRYQDRLLSCSYYCKPGTSCPCYMTEEQGEKCWDFRHQAVKGKCYQGECYSNEQFEKKSSGKSLEKARCKYAYDYMWDKRGSYGCKNYCKDAPHTTSFQPDGHPCLIPEQAAPGYCYGGNCHKNYKPNQ
uniref:7DB family protein n=1 Tax=Ornithodoros coriaceus TaxID=92741 RepID=B2D259_ORNCO|nr:7DB family protein [Ornithodoros coriaceus]